MEQSAPLVHLKSIGLRGPNAKYVTGHSITARNLYAAGVNATLEPPTVISP